TSLTVCQNSNSSTCATMVVTVGAGSTNGSSLIFSSSAPSLNVGQSQALTISGGGSGAYYISSISNPSVASVNISGSTLNVTGSSSGSSVLSICQTGGSTCGTVTVTVGSSSASTAALTFPSAALPVLNVGQNY